MTKGKTKLTLKAEPASDDEFSDYEKKLNK